MVEALEEAGQLVAAEQVAVERDLGGPPGPDDAEQVGDAACALDQAAVEGQLEPGLAALVVVGDRQGAERGQRIQPAPDERERALKTPIRSSLESGATSS
ncbi:MAG: hypothetical protein FJ125_05410 [Deltaproteobacteria bacterium]|nr:hypothetical protein [Deltaproteobacteria bacterium]